MMTCRDRMSEFQSACKSVQARQNGTTNLQHSNKPALSSHRQCSEFTVTSKKIGKDLSNTSVKLEKLTILAERKSLFDDKATSLFDDRGVEFETLTYIIAQDIGGLNKQIAQLQDLVRARGTLDGRHVQTHCSTIVVSLQSKLASMTNDFKTVRDVRMENLKQLRSRREHLNSTPASDPSISWSQPPASNSLDAKSSPLLLMQDESKAAGHVAIDMEPYGGGPLQLQLVCKQQDSDIKSRLDTIETQNLETTVVELGAIFQQLAHIVAEQGETIVRIDASVEDTQLNVEAGHKEILKYFQSVTSNRWLMGKIFLVLMMFTVVFVVFA